jgi:hypothetical protein
VWEVKAESFEWRVAAMLETSGKTQMVHSSAAWLTLRCTASELDCDKDLLKLKNQA